MAISAKVFRKLVTIMFSGLSFWPASVYFVCIHVNTFGVLFPLFSRVSIITCLNKLLWDGISDTECFLLAIWQFPSFDNLFYKDLVGDETPEVPPI